MRNVHRIIARRRLAVALWAIVVSGLNLDQPARADVKLPTLFTSNMVVQRERPVPVWGWGAPGERVVATLAGQSGETITGDDGKWMVELPPVPVGGPYELIVKGRNTLKASGVLSGEVWLASGQSNMVHIMQSVEGFEAELADSNYPNIRIFAVGGGPSRTPRDYCVSTWRPGSRDAIDDYSAVAYFFARSLHDKLGVPIGVLNASLGSTPIEAWTSLEAQPQQPELRELLASWDQRAAEYDPEKALAVYEKEHRDWEAAAAQAKADKKPAPKEPKRPIDPRDQPQHPGVMFNGLVAPLVPYGIRGVIWYQGEYNTQREDYAALYRIQLPLLIRDWRARWRQPELPFAWVQLPNFDTTTRSPRMTGWPLVREGQLQSLAVPHTGMAVTIDIGEASSVHPRNKKPFGQRLAQWALADVYGKGAVGSGPIYSSHRIAGKEIEISFRQPTGGLVARSGELRGFVIADQSKQWHNAQALIAGDKVLVSSPEVSQPIAVRYSWADNPDGNLFNTSGLPASPFRTDRD